MSSPRTSRGFVCEFERRVLQAVSNETFKNHFSELSRMGDRSGMINIILEAIESQKPVIIKDHYRPKNETVARDLIEKLDGNSTANDENVTSILTEALACTYFQSELFFNILLRRACAWYADGNLTRCMKDCRYFVDSIAQLCDDNFAEETRIDALLLYSDCCKATGANDHSKNHLNEAMRRINELAKKRCNDKNEQSDAFKAKKLEILKEFLERKKRFVPKSTVFNVEKVKANIPTVDGKVNEFLSHCSDALALGTDKIKGKLLYATRNIKPGSVLIVDRPFSFSTDIPAIKRNCFNCHISLNLKDQVKVPCKNCQAVHFCSEECLQQAWDKFHKYECRIFDYFYEKKVQKTNSLLAYRTVVTAALHVQDNLLKFNEEFLRLHENDQHTFNIKSLKKYEPQDYKTVFSLETHCTDTDEKDNLERAIYSIFFAKCLIYSINYYHSYVDNCERYLHILAVALLHNMQAINCNAYEIVENVRDEETKILEPRNIGGAIYPSVSLTNHSCYPNIVRHSFPCGTVVVTSIRFIPQGSEILDCYGQHFLENNRDSRRKQLAEKYYFKCQCEACSFDWPMSLPSDQFNFKCKKCSKQCRKTRSVAECTTCGQKTEISKLYALLQSSIKKRLSALTKMYDSYYQDALPLLLDHSMCIDKILSEPNLEGVKTQQSIIQCLNAMSSTSI